MVPPEQAVLVTLDGVTTSVDGVGGTGVPGGDRAFNVSWHDWLNLKSLIDVSRVIAAAALAREDSRGAHYREDHPQAGDLERSTYTVARWQEGAVRIDHEPVRFTPRGPRGWGM